MHCENNTYSHIPVLCSEVVRLLAPVKNGRYLDGTLGFAGHASAIMKYAGEGTEICGLDRDLHVLEYARNRLSAYGEKAHIFHLRYSNFTDALDALRWEKIDGALLDIGVSSMQLDNAERGFSFKADATLDMRMDRSGDGKTAEEIVNTASFEKLRDIIALYGEDPMASRIAHSIIAAREQSPIRTTGELASIVSRSYPRAWREKSRNHPATRTFQALRMEVNDELGELERFLDKIMPRLKVGGRLAIITFHSLEDRIVKQAMRRWAQKCRCPEYAPVCTCGHQAEAVLLCKKPIVATKDEIRANSRASCAKLRGIEKISEVLK